jgi:hypothetical protein
VNWLRACCAELPEGLGSVRRRDETIQPRAHFLDCLALQGMPMMSEDDGRAR